LFFSKKLSFLLLPLVFATSCMPNFLHKYAAEKERREVEASNKPGPVKRQSISSLGDGVFRLALPYERVWDAMLDVLLRNYNLQIAEKTSGLITTEWDSYYLDGKVHRNKVSLRMKRLAGQQVEMSIHNSVEVLSRLPDGGVTEVWLPSDKNKVEIGRIVQNVAIAMGVPKPILPQEMTAQGTPPPADADKQAM
jgi:hypothetical protein